MNKKCSNCLHHDKHPFDITYIEDICLGCHTHEEKNDIDWSQRHEKLLQIVAISKKSKTSHSIYDCIIPVRGVAEDYYVVEQVLYLELNPLLVAINDYFFNDIGWHNLHNLITVFDLDSQVYSPNLSNYKELVATCFRKYQHILYPSLSLNASYPVHVAIERNIPLIIWGQFQPIEQVGKFSHYDSVEMTKWSHLEHDRIGYDIDEIIGNGAQLNPKSLFYYDYPPQTIRLGQKSPKGVYLSNFLRWDPLKQNHSILKYGFKPQQETATYDPYERAGSSVYYSMHELSRLLRHGYRKVRDHLNREIRHNRLNQAMAIEIYDYYNSQKINLNPFFDWLEVTKSGKEWILQHLLSEYTDLIDTEPVPSHFHDILPEQIKSLIASSYLAETEFITFGKGI